MKNKKMTHKLKKGILLKESLCIRGIKGNLEKITNV